MATMTDAQKAEQKRLKAIPNQAMKDAIAGLNAFLKEQGMDEIKIEKSKGLTVTGFETAISTLIEADKAADIPEDVATFYNDFIVGEAEEETPAEKPAKKKTAKAKKEAKPKKPSNEQATYDMIVANKSDKDILAHFTKVYDGKGKDAAFIEKRAGIYTNIAKRKFAKENPEEAAKRNPEPVKKAAKKAPAKTAAKKTVAKTGKAKK